MKSWNQFLETKGKFEEKISAVKTGQVALTNPGLSRPLVWMNLVHPEKGHDYLNYYKKKPEGKCECFEKVKEDCLRVIQGSFDSSDKAEKVLNLLNIFLIRNQDFVYDIGLVFVGYSLYSVLNEDCDTFVMTCYLFEEVIPKDIFTGENSNEKLRKNSKNFVEFAKKLRPKIAKSLAYKFKDKGEEKTDYSVFENVLQNLIEKWLSVLFYQNLVSSDLFRVFDCIFVFGPEFINKFALALLSHHESFFLNSLKSELKSFKLPQSPELLKICANVAKNKLLKKIEKVPIEKLIKKTLTKPNYQLLLPENIQVLKGSRVLEIRKLISDLGYFSIEQGVNMIESLETFEDQVSRPVFTNLFFRTFNWPIENVLKFFAVFDQKGADALQVLYLKISLILLVKGFSQKLELLFKSIQSSGWISRKDLIQLVQKLEEVFDCHQTFYLKNSKIQIFSFENLGKIEFQHYLQTDPFFSPLVQMIQDLDESKESLEGIKEKSIKTFEFSLSSPEKSPISAISDNDIDSDIPRLTLNHSITTVSDRLLNMSLVSPAALSSHITEKDNFYESVQIIKDPEHEESSQSLELQKHNLESQPIDQQNIDLLNSSQNKQRTCGRLCTENCSII